MSHTHNTYVQIFVAPASGLRVSGEIQLPLPRDLTPKEAALLAPYLGADGAPPRARLTGPARGTWKAVETWLYSALVEAERLREEASREREQSLAALRAALVEITRALDEGRLVEVHVGGPEEYPAGASPRVHPVPGCSDRVEWRASHILRRAHTPPDLLDEIAVCNARVAAAVAAATAAELARARAARAALSDADLLAAGTWALDDDATRDRQYALARARAEAARVEEVERTWALIAWWPGVTESLRARMLAGVAPDAEVYAPVLEVLLAGREPELLRDDGDVDDRGPDHPPVEIRREWSGPAWEAYHAVRDCAARVRAILPEGWEVDLVGYCYPDGAACLSLAVTGASSGTVRVGWRLPA